MHRLDGSRECSGGSKFDCRAEGFSRCEGLERRGKVLGRWVELGKGRMSGLVWNREESVLGVYILSCVNQQTRKTLEGEL